MRLLNSHYELNGKLILLFNRVILCSLELQSVSFYTVTAVWICHSCDLLTQLIAVSFYF